MVTLTSTVPGAPRTETVDYGSRRVVWGSPHAAPRTTLRLPDLDTADSNPAAHHDDMLNVAAAVRGNDAELEMLCASPLHVRELALLLAEQDLAAIDLRESMESARRQTCDALNQLAATRALLADAQELRVAALADLQDMRAMAIRLSEENRALRLGGAAYLDLQARVDSVARTHVVTPSRVVEVYGEWDTSDVDDHDTIVMDVAVVL